MEIDKWFEKVERCEVLPEKELKKLCLYVIEIMIEEPNVIPAQTPVTVVGDIHGQFHDLLNIFEQGGKIPSASYVFMGDYVDRGFHSIETLTYLLLLKAKYPKNIVLLRGNHECRQITTIYGFYDEIVKKYGNGSAWKYCTDVFDVMSVAALIDNKILCVHGGLSPHVKTIDQIQIIDRRMEIPHEGAFCDLVWSDPEEITTWEVSPRGAGYLFGTRVAKEFCEMNDLELICRAHQIVNEGHKYHFKEKLVATIWSAPNYCYRCGNLASILQIDVQRQQSFKTFKEVEENLKTAEMISQNKPSYFL